MSMSRRKFLKEFGIASTLAGYSSSLLALQNNLIKSREIEVLVIGSGPAGLSLADKLSLNGVQVTVIESGVNSRNHRHQSLANISNKKSLPFDLNFASQRLVGGSSLYWGGYCPRMMQSDFLSKTKYDYGVDWPVSFELMNHYYCEAEKWLQVGTAYNYSNCNHSGLSPFQFSSEQWLNSLTAEGINDLYPASVSMNQKGTYAPLQLKKSRASEYSSRKNLNLLLDSTARHIDFDKTGRARGVHVKSLRGHEDFIKADVVVLAAGAIQNTRLLQLSDSSLFPDGAGNSGGQLGENFMEHPHVRFWMKTSEMWKKLPPTQLHLYKWYTKNKEKGFGSLMVLLHRFNKQPGWYKKQAFGNLLLDVICEQEPQASNKLGLDMNSKDIFGDPLPILNYSLSKRDNETITLVPNLIHELLDVFDGDYVIETGAFGAHLMGTTRMAKNDGAGVVDSNQRVFGTKNLYVSGSSVFPTGGAANPTLTLTALSLRLADHLLSSAKNYGFKNFKTAK